ncbi:MAG: hypothetical protein ACC682_06670, partial [Gemmatimonadota bacterium]
MTHQTERGNQANAGRPGGPFQVHDGGKSASSRGLNVLLIATDVEFRDELSGALDRFGIGLLWRARILGLLDAVADSQPAAVILSADVPGSDPLELIRAIRQQPSWARLPVFLVGRGMPRALELRAFAEGVDAVLERDGATPELVARLLGHSAIETRRRSGTAKSIADAALALCVASPELDQAPRETPEVATAPGTDSAPPAVPESGYGS